ncbi:Ion channel [Labeo rohita]|uniref:Ion channel n=1 Tax=Labeo rohita TaxID=84645 RepID=A0A498MVP0_LABRO|nr:Ion channel [Labeo rohita]
MLFNKGSSQRETWENTVRIGRKLDVFHQQCLRCILRVTYHDHVTNEEILRRAKTSRLFSTVSECRIELTGRIMRQSEQPLAKTALTLMPPNGRRSESMRLVFVHWTYTRCCPRDHAGSIWIPEPRLTTRSEPDRT